MQQLKWEDLRVGMGVLIKGARTLEQSTIIGLSTTHIGTVKMLRLKTGLTMDFNQWTLYEDNAENRTECLLNNYSITSSNFSGKYWEVPKVNL